MCQEKTRSVYVSEHSVGVCGENISSVCVCVCVCISGFHGEKITSVSFRRQWKDVSREDQKCVCFRTQCSSSWRENRPVCVCVFQNTVKDFAERSKGILQESMKWAPNAVRSHLIHYVLTTENSSSGMHQHSGLALATESVLNYAGYNKNAAPLGVSWMHAFTLYHQICLDEPRGCAGGGAVVQKHQQWRRRLRNLENTNARFFLCRVASGTILWLLLGATGAAAVAQCSDFAFLMLSVTATAPALQSWGCAIMRLMVRLHGWLHFYAYDGDRLDDLSHLYCLHMW